MLRVNKITAGYGNVRALWDVSLRIDEAEIYTTASPCWNCFKLIANAGIRTVYYGEFYRDTRSIEIAKQLGIRLIDLSSV